MFKRKVKSRGSTKASKELFEVENWHGPGKVILKFGDSTSILKSDFVAANVGKHPKKWFKYTIFIVLKNGVTIHVGKFSSGCLAEMQLERITWTLLNNAAYKSKTQNSSEQIVSDSHF
jgi:helix-turn-helix protein